MFILLPGSVMNGFQATTNTRIKISQNNDFFPETVDRVIVITGQPENVRAGLATIIEKMCEVSKPIIGSLLVKMSYYFTKYPLVDVVILFFSDCYICTYATLRPHFM
jgi:hypothetical protein